MISREVAQTEVYLAEQEALRGPSLPIVPRRMPIARILGLVGALLLLAGISRANEIEVRGCKAVRVFSQGKPTAIYWDSRYSIPAPNPLVCDSRQIVSFHVPSKVKVIIEVKP